MSFKVPSNLSSLWFCLITDGPVSKSHDINFVLCCTLEIKSKFTEQRDMKSLEGVSQKAAESHCAAELTLQELQCRKLLALSPILFPAHKNKRILVYWAVSLISFTNPEFIHNESKFSEIQFYFYEDFIPSRNQYDTALTERRKESNCQINFSFCSTVHPVKVSKWKHFTLTQTAEKLSKRYSSDPCWLNSGKTISYAINSLLLSITLKYLIISYPRK